MIRERMVPLAGLVFVATAALMLATIISRSPYTHSNLARTLPSDYDRTPLAAVGEADLGAIQAELAELPPVTYPVSTARRPSQGSGAMPATAFAEVRTGKVDSSAVGRALFTQKCTSCHTIGEGRRVGPDLKGITSQRPDGWLVQFITAPDAVIARGDPIAAQLVKAYGLPMPNLDISTVQAEALLEYIAAKSSAADPGGVQLVGVPAAPASDGAKAPAAAPAQQDTSRGKALFDQKCASCHSVGGGKLVGPDLKGVTALRPRDWLVEFIATPDKVIARGDATAAQLVKEYGMPMPNLGVSSADAELMLAYLEAAAGGSAAGQGAAAPVGAAAPAVAGNAANGRALFTGERPLARGGPACLSCHNVAGVGGLAGGTWGLDLTRSQATTGPAGLAAIMKAPPFPGMAEAFLNHPITDGEVADLLAFLAAVQAQPADGPADLTFALVGLVILAAGMALAQILWRRRAGGVRKQLIARRQ